MSAVIVEPLHAGAALKAMRLARRRGLAAVKVHVSYDDYFDLRQQSLDKGPMQDCMRQQEDGQWTLFGVLLDFEHPPGSPRELSLKFMGLPAVFRPAGDTLTARTMSKAEFRIGSIHKETIQ